MPTWTATHRLTAGAVVVAVVWSTPPTVLAPHVSGLEARAIACLAAIRAAQLLHSSTYRVYAATLEDLAGEGERNLLGCLSRRDLQIELFSSVDRYAAVAIPQQPQPQRRGRTQAPSRAFCVDDLTGSIYATPHQTGTPSLERGRCRGTSKPLV